MAKTITMSIQRWRMQKSTHGIKTSRKSGSVPDARFPDMDALSLSSHMHLKVESVHISTHISSERRRNPKTKKARLIAVSRAMQKAFAFLRGAETPGC